MALYHLGFSHNLSIFSRYTHFILVCSVHFTFQFQLSMLQKHTRSGVTLQRMLNTMIIVDGDKLTAAIA